MASGKFSLPKRRDVTETEWTVMLGDVTETPIERPKQSSGTTLADRPGGGASRTCHFVQDVEKSGATRQYGHSPALVGLVPEKSSAN